MLHQIWRQTTITASHISGSGDINAIRKFRDVELTLLIFCASSITLIVTAACLKLLKPGLR